MVRSTTRESKLKGLSLNVPSFQSSTSVPEEDWTFSISRDSYARIHRTLFFYPVCLFTETFTPFSFLCTETRTFSPFSRPVPSRFKSRWGFLNLTLQTEHVDSSVLGPVSKRSEQGYGTHLVFSSLWCPGTLLVSGPITPIIVIGTTWPLTRTKIRRHNRFPLSRGCY